VTSQQKQIVQTIFADLRTQVQATSNLFYGHLFEINPRLEKLFVDKLRNQGPGLMQTIAIAVRDLDRFDEMVPLLHELGERYAGYGVEESDYETVCTAWLWTLERSLGEGFTSEVRAAWIAVYELMADAMKTGAQEALIVTAVPVVNKAVTGASRNGNSWREYFPSAANKNLKRRETEMKAIENYETLTARFATTMATLIFVLLIATATASAKTITVTGTGDTIAVDGVVTLREAITAANTNATSGDAPAGDPGLDVINFNIAGGGVKTITPTSALPTITDPITINGYTQPGASPNTLAVGSDAVLLIELNGANAGATTSALMVTAGNSTIRGLVINHFAAVGVYLQTNDSNVVAGNFIGTNATGTAAFSKPNNNIGVYVKSANNIIGGTLPADRNVLSGNFSASGGLGLWLDGITAHNNKVIGNYIGTSADGATAVPNVNTGIILNSCISNIIGGTTAAERNVISGNNTNGVSINSAAANNQIMGNFIGTKADGVSPLKNSQSGFDIENGPTNNTIGGTAAGAGNVIAFNGTGIFINNSTNNAILGNSIYSSPSGLGIDLSDGVVGVTPNDNNTGDADTGANNLQNFPVITSVVSNGGTTTIKGTLDSAFSTQFRLEFFSNTAPNASGFGEGQTFLGSVNLVTDASGKAGFTFNVPTANVVGGSFSATATDPAGNTSEFAASASGVVSSPGTLQFSTNSITQIENTGNFTINVTRTGGTTGTVTVHYATADGTAKAPSDYTNTSGTLTFNDGDTSKPITVPLIDDNTPEGSEVFTLALSNPTGGALLGNLSSATLIIQDNEEPTLSISDVSQAEGNSGTTAFTFTVTSSNAITNDVNATYATSDGTATAGSDYQAANGVVIILAGQTSKTITVNVNGDTTQESDETFFVNLSLAGNATIVKAKGTGTIINDDAPAAPSVQFSSAGYSAPEELGAVTITVTRSGDTSGAMTVDYATGDGTAKQKSDYEIAAGTLSFAQGEASKSFQILINEDMYIEGDEVFNLSLTNPSGAVLGPQSSSIVTIVDDVPESLINPIDDSQSFVHMHYHDFLNREPDAAGLQFWTNQITGCGQDASCIAAKRTNVSAAYFLSIEFQQTSYLLYLMQKESFSVLPKYVVFMRDLQEISRDVVVNSPGWEQKLSDNQQQFAERWVNRASFKATYDGMSNAAYVNALYANAGVVPPQAERDSLVTKLDTATESRAAAVLEVAADAAFHQQEQNPAFVLMQYFGYLRRDPDSGPDSDLSGYFFWLSKLNAFNGDYQKAEMVKAFITSGEYRARFGQQ